MTVLQKRVINFGKWAVLAWKLRTKPFGVTAPFLHHAVPLASKLGINFITSVKLAFMVFIDAHSIIN